VVDDLGPRGVDHERARLEAGEQVCPDQAAGLGAEGHMDAQDVGPVGNLGRAGDDRDPPRTAGRIEAVGSRIERRVGLEAAGPDHEVEAKGLGSAGQLLGDVAEAEQAQRGSLEALRLRELLLVPVPRAELGDVVGNPPVEGQDQPESQLGDRDRVLAGAIRDVDPVGRCCAHVDRVVAGPGPHDQGQVGRIQHLGGDGRRAHDEHLRAAVDEGSCQRFVLERGIEDDLAVAGGEAVQAGLLELIGDEDLHRARSLR